MKASGVVIASRRRIAAAVVAATAVTVTSAFVTVAPTVDAATPAYAIYHAPESTPGAHDAGEPSIGTDWLTGAVMYQAGLTTLRVTGLETGAPQWTDVSAPQTGLLNLDPILYTDSPLGHTLAGGLDGTCSVLAVTDDDGATWGPTVNPCSTGGWDHETVGGGRYHSPAPATATFADAVYYCSQTGLSPGPAWCARSDDGGVVFGPGVPTWTTECGGLHGHVKVGPDGTVYLPNGDCSGRAGMGVSADNGQTWSVTTIPDSSTQDESDPSVAVDAAGKVYECYQGGSDTNNGSFTGVATYANGTWSPSQVVSPAVQNVQFPAMVAGDSGRAACAFLGTPTGGDDQSDTFTGVWQLYVATTTDGGATWTTVQATPDSDPVQKGCIWMSGGSSSCRNLLDFMDAQVTKDGHVVVGYADGCTSTCDSGGAANHDALASIAYQTGGDLLTGPLTTTTGPGLTVPSASQNLTASPATGNGGRGQGPPSEEAGSRTR